MSSGLIASRLTSPNRNYPTCERTCVVLKIYPEFLSAADVSKSLEIEPTESHDKGEKLKNSIGRTRESKRTGWFLSSEDYVDSLDLRHHLDWLISKLEPCKEHLIVLQEMEGMKMSVGCVWWSLTGDGGPTLWPEQMSALANLNLECSFDIYFHGDQP
jgi:hypothetical protein